jgi:hypothetical protein
MRPLRICLLATLVSTMVLPAQADGSFYGRWVVDPFDCPADRAAVPSIVVTAPALKWQDTVCNVRSSYLVRDSWHVSIRCTDAARDVPVALHLRGDRLAIDWGGATVQFRRCP